MGATSSWAATGSLCSSEQRPKAATSSCSGEERSSVRPVRIAMNTDLAIGDKLVFGDQLAAGDKLGGDKLEERSSA